MNPMETTIKDIKNLQDLSPEIMRLINDLYKLLVEK